uniref:Allantoicase domain-containing protein n=1 Tax=Bicosoecida sp. CB-2014 TaxID=1486930 RepID=A0A7S1G9S0_9STRA
MSAEPAPAIASRSGYAVGGFVRQPKRSSKPRVKKPRADGGATESDAESTASSASGASKSGSEREREVPAWKKSTEMVSARVGGKCLFATDEWFATAENMLKTSEPVFIPDKFTEFGKWMDGWETRRKRTVGHDWCILQLGLPGVIFGIHVNTAHFTGNYVPRVSVQGAYLDEAPRDLVDSRGEGGVMGTCATREQLAAAAELRSEEWEELVPMSKLGPGFVDTRDSYFTVRSTKPYTHLRVNMHPDGGIARLHVHGIVRRDWEAVPDAKVVDLVAAENGGRAVAWSDEHYGKPSNIIVRRRGVNMGDGWETARKMNRPPAYEADDAGNLVLPGMSDWAVFELGHAGVVTEVEVDTQHFKGNFPESCLVEATLAPRTSTDFADGGKALTWHEIVPRRVAKLSANASHVFPVSGVGAVSHIRLTMFPDGGIMRFRVRGRVDRAAEARVKEETVMDPIRVMSPVSRARLGAAGVPARSPPGAPSPGL